MSCLLPIEANEINLIRENGLTIREFSKIPTYPEYNTYESCALWIYKTPTKLNYFETKYYRNHYTLYKSADSIVIVMTETSLIYTSTDAVLTFHVIKPTTASRVFENKWGISFDKIEYSKERPNNFSNYHLHSTGEWWYFDNGVVLNGVSCLLDEPVESVLIYFELHPPALFYVKLNNNNRQTKSFLNLQTTAKTDVSNDLENKDSKDNKSTNSEKHNSIFTVSTLPDIFSSRANKTLNLKQTNNTKAIKGKLQNIIPPLFWFESRARELETSNIEYFRAFSNISVPLNTLPEKSNISNLFNIFQS